MQKIKLLVPLNITAVGIIRNSIPIFNGLAGIYRLELIPANMIKYIEVISGRESALYGFTRDQAMFDPNDDSFSELSPLNNPTIGTRLFHRFTHR